ncbi:MAG: ABC transporter permease subunit [Candidatus Marinimicrobia bacterium]|nr:ABC transporter permease subunit [Candidatus Neomarinimicrobiota bacterium]
MFIILQMAPGGPLEKTIQQIQMGSSQGGGEGGATSNGSSGAGTLLPKRALKELERFYGFDKPIWQRYLIWLGVWKREIKHRNLAFKIGDIEVKKNMGKRRYAYVRKNGAKLEVYDKEGNISKLWTARFDMDISDEEITNFDELKNNGELSDISKLEATIYETEYSGVLTGNLGKSYTYQQPVIEVMKPRFKVSILLGLSGWLIAYLVCIPLGIKKALSHGSTFDLISSAVVFMAYSIPGWAFGGVLLVLFGGGSFWDVFPLGGLHSPQEIWVNLSFFEKVLDQLHHVILPIIAWTIGSFATLTVLMKNSLLDNLSQDYIRTAFAKGLSEKRVIWVHAVRNSVIPIASGIGYIIATIIAGSYFIEMIFNINGFGKMGFQAILDRDYPITMGFLVIAVIIRLIANLLSDLALAAVDPRIRFK